MEVLLDYFKTKEQCRGLVPFLGVYYLMTKAVAQKYVLEKNFYKDFKRLERLDVHFASLYFTPLRAFLETGRSRRPWQRYFAYATEERGIPFLKMLLGINAHINADLCRTLVALNYHVKEDFLTINAVLEEVMPEIIKYLALHDHDVFALAGLIFRKFFVDEFHNIIVHWRNETWENARRLSAPAATPKTPWPRVHRATETIGQKLVRIFEDILHFRGLNRALPELHELAVRV